MTTDTRAERRRETRTTTGEAKRLNDAIEQEFSQIQPLYDLMDEDFDRWSLKPYVIDPDTDGVIAPEDAYTTNNPRVLAGKIIAFLESTTELIRIPYSTEKEEQERANSDAERFAIGCRDIADKRLVRKGQGKSKNQLAWASTVRTGRIFLRGLLLKDERGNTVPDLLPFDPRHTAVRFGADEPEWVAVRKIQSRRELRRRFTGFKFQDEAEDSGNDFNEHESAFDVYYRRRNPDFDVDDDESQPYTYWNGVLTAGKWARKPEELFTTRFPIAVVATDATMPLSPTEREDQPFLQEGSSIFAENRGIWDTKNRLGSYANHLAHLAADPPKSMRSIDGEAELDEGSNEPGSVIPLSTANDESVENMITADLNNASSLINQIVRTDELGGSLPPQAFGILDQGPVSAVGLRQLGLNIEQKVIPRMNAIAEATEYALETMMLQYDTGEYKELEVIGRDFRGQRFQQNIQPEAIKERQRLQVEMRLALPQDEQQRWAIAQIASQQTAFGEPLGDLDFVREEILNMPDPGFVTRQNDQTLAWQATPLSQILKLFRATLESGDEQQQAILFDQLQLTAMKQQLETNVQIQQLMQMAQGLGVAPGAGDPNVPQGAGQQQVLTGGLGNPATGAPGVAEVTGIGNTPSPEAGANTTAPRPGAQSEQAQRLAAIGLVPN